jgi:hypothetical protein
VHWDAVAEPEVVFDEELRKVVVNDQQYTEDPTVELLCHERLPSWLDQLPGEYQKGLHELGIDVPTLVLLAFLQQGRDKNAMSK